MSELPTSKERIEHELKISSQFFDVVESGQKPFEIRKGDRPYKIDDVLWLREVDILLTYTGREMRKRITFVLRGWGMESGYVALGLAPLHVETPALHEIPWKNPVAAWPDIVGAIRAIYPAGANHEGHKGCAEIALTAADEIEKLRDAEKATEKRAYHETHEAPHCPTCDCGAVKTEERKHVLAYGGDCAAHLSEALQKEAQR